MRPAAIDLFSGAGGLTAGLRASGFRVLAAVDNERLAVETYRVNHPDTRVWDADIRELDPASIMRALGLRRGELDLLAGCPPCQGFSTMRTRNGGVCVSDPQNDLVFEFMRFVAGLRPRAVMMENVPALKADARMAYVRKRLRELGYDARDEILNTARYGVPQRRRRFVLIALRGGVPRFGVEAEGPATVADAIRGLPRAGSSGDPLHDLPERRSAQVREMIRRIPKNGGSRSDLPAEFHLACHARSDGWKDVYGRMAWKRPAPTITGGCVNPSKGRFLHPTCNRTITLREAALLQAFPPDYYFSLRKGKFAAAQLIGNALPPVFIERHARVLWRDLHAGARRRVLARRRRRRPRRR